eukprot:267177-Alexandrium_andersonii.AAC.2
MPSNKERTTNALPVVETGRGTGGGAGNGSAGRAGVAVRARAGRSGRRGRWAPGAEVFRPDALALPAAAPRCLRRVRKVREAAELAAGPACCPSTNWTSSSSTYSIPSMSACSPPTAAGPAGTGWAGVGMTGVWIGSPDAGAATGAEWLASQGGEAAGVPIGVPTGGAATAMAVGGAGSPGGAAIGVAAAVSISIRMEVSVSSGGAAGPAVGAAGPAGGAFELLSVADKRLAIERAVNALRASELRGHAERCPAVGQTPRGANGRPVRQRATGKAAAASLKPRSSIASAATPG